MTAVEAATLAAAAIANAVTSAKLAVLQERVGQAEHVELLQQALANQQQHIEVLAMQVHNAQCSYLTQQSAAFAFSELHTTFSERLPVVHEALIHDMAQRHRMYAVQAGASTAGENAELVERVKMLESQLEREKYRNEALDEVTRDLAEKLAHAEQLAPTEARSCKHCPAYKQREQLALQRIESLGKKVGEREQRVKELERGLDELDHLRSAQMQLEEAVKVGDSRFKEADNRFQDAQGRLEAIKVEREQLRGQLEQAHGQCQCLADQLSDVQSDLHRRQASTERDRSLLQDLRARFEQSSVKNHELQHQLAEMEAAHEQALSRVSEAKAISIESEARAATLAQAKEVADRDLSRLNDVVEKMRLDVQDAKSVMERLQVQESSLQNELANSTDALSVSLKENQEAARMIHSLRQEVDQTKSRLSSEEKLLRKLEMDLKQAKGEATQAQVQHVEDAQLIESLSNEVKTLQGRLERSEKVKLQLQMGVPMDKQPHEERENRDGSGANNVASAEALARAKMVSGKMSKQLASAKKLLKEAQKESNRFRFMYEQQKQLMEMQRISQS